MPRRTADELEDKIVLLRKELAEQGLDAGAHTIHYHLGVSDPLRHRCRRSGGCSSDGASSPRSRTSDPRAPTSASKHHCPTSAGNSPSLGLQEDIGRVSSTALRAGLSNLWLVQIDGRSPALFPLHLAGCSGSSLRSPSEFSCGKGRAAQVAKQSGSTHFDATGSPHPVDQASASCLAAKG